MLFHRAKRGASRETRLGSVNAVAALQLHVGRTLTFSIDCLRDCAERECRDWQAEPMADLSIRRPSAVEESRRIPAACDRSTFFRGCKSYCKASCHAQNWSGHAEIA